MCENVKHFAINKYIQLITEEWVKKKLIIIKSLTFSQTSDCSISSSKKYKLYNFLVKITYYLLN